MAPGLMTWFDERSVAMGERLRSLGSRSARLAPGVVTLAEHLIRWTPPPLLAHLEQLWSSVAKVAQMNDPQTHPATGSDTSLVAAGKAFLWDDSVSPYIKEGFKTYWETLDEVGRYQ